MLGVLRRQVLMRIALLLLSLNGYLWLHPYTTCLVHTLSSLNLRMLKGAYKSFVEVSNIKFQTKNLNFV
jgi:hypothetical protein